MRKKDPSYRKFLKSNLYDLCADTCQFFGRNEERILTKVFSLRYMETLKTFQMFQKYLPFCKRKPRVRTLHYFDSFISQTVENSLEVSSLFDYYAETV